MKFWDWLKPEPRPTVQAIIYEEESDQELIRVQLRHKEADRGMFNLAGPGDVEGKRAMELIALIRLRASTDVLTHMTPTYA